jgi:hypothetical protein
MFGYPTSAQIMRKPRKFRPGTIRVVLEWKREFAGNLREPQSLQELCGRLADHYGNPLRAVKFDPTCWIGPHYTPATRTITLTNGSIVSAMHEVGHHLFGRSELQACRFSVWLYKRTFSRSFGRCHFEPGSHMLRAPRVNGSAS